MRAGLSVIPIPPGKKNPNRRNWQAERWTFEDIPELWTNGQNIGVLLGEPSGGLVDVDLDWPEARIAARHILPDTRTSGRESQPDSHRWYYAEPLPRTKPFKLPGKGDDRSVVELRSTGGQTVVAPSRHPDGDRYIWGGGEIVRVDGEALVADVADVATAALIARNWPGQGARHDYALAATGYIGRHIPRDRAEQIMGAAIAASNDDEAHKRHRDVTDTLDGLAAGRPTTGGPTLDKLAPGVVDQLRRWCGWGTNSEGQPQANGSNPKSGGGPGIVKMLADAITTKDHFAQDAGGKLYRFSGGAYREYAERYIRRRVKELLEVWEQSAKWSSHRASEVAEYIRADAPELWERPPLGEVNVRNGILNVETQELREHDPAFLSPVQIPVSYDAEARCPAWERFISEVFPEDARELAFELAADLITPSRSAQKAVLLLGEGSNGKSTFLRALTAFVGSTNAAGVSLHKLESDRFSAARLIGKLTNICPDLPSAHLTGTSAFKAITGGDDLHAEYKYRDSFEFRPYCRLVFSANHVPRSGDASHAFFRRWLVVPFERTFEPGEQVPREVLDARLADPRELAGVLNRALEVLPRVRREGFTESEKMREAHDEFRSMTDPVSVWLARRTVEAAEAFIPKGALLEAYNADCEEQGRAGMTSTAFGLAIKRARPRIEDAQRTVNGKPRVKVWLGIALRHDGDDGGGGGDAPPRNPRNPRNPVSPIVSNPTSYGSESTEGAINNNRENRVTPVTSVTLNTTPRDDRGVEKVVELLADPPDWLATQLGLLRSNPELIPPTCSAISYEVYGTSARWGEVRPALQAHLKGGAPAA
jgi:putative DNA primase/helicase